MSTRAKLQKARRHTKKWAKGYCVFWQDCLEWFYNRYQNSKVVKTTNKKMITEIKLEIVVNNERKMAVFLDQEKIDSIMVSSEPIATFIKDLVVAEEEKVEEAVEEAKKEGVE